ncbi:MAG: hypothetical protein ACOZDD_00315 [Bacteroidota bacterium]
MRITRTILAVLVVIPFLFSVSGILVIQSHCTCTGKNQISLYLPPETCSDILEDHHHLFTFHSADLNHCTSADYQCAGHDGHDHCGNHETGCTDCGCDSPLVQFFQIDNQFTDEKASFHKYLEFRDAFEIVSEDLSTGSPETEKINLNWFNDPPPLISAQKVFIHFICQIKVPSIA